MAESTSSQSFPCAFSLSVAGFDPTGGAGVLMDVKVMKEIGVWCFSVVSCITAQNSTGVFEVKEVPDHLMLRQIELIMEDCGEKIKYVKVGALGGEGGVRAVMKMVDDFGVKIVLDPVMRAKNGFPLISTEGEKLMRDMLIPQAFVITPNVPEVERLLNIRIKGKDDVIKAGEKLSEMTDAYVIIKGGHIPSEIGEKEREKEDFVFHRGKLLFSVKGKAYKFQVHGTGCIFSSAICAYLSLGFEPADAFVRASRFTKRAIAKFSKVGKGFHFALL